MLSERCRVGARERERKRDYASVAHDACNARGSFSPTTGRRRGRNPSYTDEPALTHLQPVDCCSSHGRNARPCERFSVNRKRREVNPDASPSRNDDDHSWLQDDVLHPGAAAAATAETRAHRPSWIALLSMHVNLHMRIATSADLQDQAFIYLRTGSLYDPQQKILLVEVVQHVSRRDPILIIRWMWVQWAAAQDTLLQPAIRCLQPREYRTVDDVQLLAVHPEHSHAGPDQVCEGREQWDLVCVSRQRPLSAQSGTVYRREGRVQSSSPLGSETARVA